MTRLPSLGPRGEGWVVIQLFLLAGVFMGSNRYGDVWSGTVAVASSVAGTLLIIVGAALFLRGVIDLGSGLTPMPRPRGGAKLVESGAFALVRHPLYGGLILGSFGWALIQASPIGLLAAASLGIFFNLKSRREEAWLLEEYAGYKDYMKRTRRLIPWIY